MNSPGISLYTDISLSQSWMTTFRLSSCLSLNQTFSENFSRKLQFPTLETKPECCAFRNQTHTQGFKPLENLGCKFCRILFNHLSYFWQDRTNVTVNHQDPKSCNKNFKTRKKRKEEEKRLTFLALVNNRQWLCIIGLPAPKLVLLATHSAENNGRAHILLFFFLWQYNCVNVLYIIAMTSSVIKLFLFSSLYLAATVYVWDAEVCRRIMDTGCYSYCIYYIYYNLISIFDIYIYCICCICVVGWGIPENNGLKAEIHALLLWQYICVNGLYIAMTSRAMKLLLFSSFYLAATVYMWDAEVCRRIMDTGCSSYCIYRICFKFNINIYCKCCIYVWDAEVCGRIMDTGCHSYCTDCIYFKFNRYIFCIYVGCGE